MSKAGGEVQDHDGPASDREGKALRASDIDGDPREGTYGANASQKDRLELATNLPVATFDDAVAKLGWYAMRWKIEVYHKILKSGCRAETAKLRTAQRLTNLIALFCVLIWRVFWITMLNRVVPKAPAGVAFAPYEIDIFAGIAGSGFCCTVASCVRVLARLGGYLARAQDPPPGNTVIWRGLSRLADIQLGASLQVGNMGN